MLVVCATFRDHRELPRLGRPGLNFLFHDYASTSLEELICGGGEVLDGAADPVAEIARIRAAIGDRDIAAIVSTDDYPGAALAAVLAEELGLPGPRPESEPRLPEQISVATGAKPHRSGWGSSLLADRRCRARRAPR